MARPLLVAPSILAADFARLGEELRTIDQAGADWIHIDVMDGHFVPNISIGPDVVKALRPHSKKTFDVHLMIAPCDPYLEAFAKAGSDIITVHVESGPHVHRSLQAIRALGKKAGVTLNPATPVETIANVIDLVDLILIMSVNPGFGGQKFIPAAEEKIARARALVGARPIDIEVDGGITPANATLVARAGANVLVAGSAVFRGGSAESYRANIAAIRNAAAMARGEQREVTVALTAVSAARAPDIAPPEPHLTPDELLARAQKLVPLLRARQAECEAIGKVPDDINAELVRQGFYRIVQPRRFGGYEFDIPTFYKVMMEISRGCSETGWVLSLTAGHPVIAAFFSEQGQCELYGPDGEFRCPAGFNPPGTAVPADGGYRVSGSWVSASGIDHATHFVTMAAVESATPHPVPAILIMLERGEITILDDWRVMGMQGTGSKSVTADVFVPASRTAALKAHGMLTSVTLPGPRIHDNPMYYGRIGAFLIGEGASVAIGAARGALDLFEDVLRTKKSPLPPFLERDKDPEFQHHYGTALAKIATAEAALLRQGEDYMDYARADADGSAPFDLAREQRLTLIGLQAIQLAWEAIDLIYRTAGTSASVKEGQPIGRVFRNIAAIRTHPILQLDRNAVNAARTRFGV